MRRGPVDGVHRRSGPLKPAGLLGWVDRNDVSRAAALELHYTIDEGKQRIVIASADVPARVETGAALAHHDAAGSNRLTTEALDAQAVRVAIPAVSAGTDAFLVCHSLPVYFVPGRRAQESATLSIRISVKFCR